MNKAVWRNGKKKITGYWSYNRAADRFFISLDSMDRITGERREFHVYDDTPEWGNWKLEKDTHEGTSR